MNLKKHAFSITYGVILALVSGGFLFLLVKTRGNFVEVKEKLQKAETDYLSLSNADPHPSAENVRIVQTNLQLAVDFYVDLQSRLCRNQEPIEALGAAQFNVLLQDTFASLRATADWEGASDEVSGTLLPEPFYFGFDQYTGALPEEESIPRLIRQLRTIEMVCNLLFENRVSVVERIQREVFELGVEGGVIQGRGGDRLGAGVFLGGADPLGSSTVDREESDLYTVEHVDVIFQARDEQVWQLLDAFGFSSGFVVVTDVALANTDPPDQQRGGRRTQPAIPMNRGGRDQLDLLGGRTPGVRGQPTGMTGRTAPGTAGRTPAEQTILLAREERVVAGRDEWVQVTLGLDVYRFCPEGEEDDPLADDPLAVEAEGGLL